MHEDIEKEISEKSLEIRQIKALLKDKNDKLKELIEKYAEAKGLEESDQTQLEVQDLNGSKLDRTKS